MFLVYVSLAAVFFGLAVSRANVAAFLFPVAVGALMAGALYTGLALTVQSVRRAVRAGVTCAWGSGEVAARMRDLRILWFVGLAATLLTALLVSATGNDEHSFSWLSAAMGCLFQAQPRLFVWSITRDITALLNESRG